MKKFELTSEFITNIFGTKLFRIKALVEFGNVKKENSADMWKKRKI